MPDESHGRETCERAGQFTDSPCAPLVGAQRAGTCSPVCNSAVPAAQLHFGAPSPTTPSTAREPVHQDDLRVLDGPFAESKELIGGFTVMELAGGMDEAIAMCRRYAEILGGTLEIDVRTVDTSEQPAG